MKSDLIRRSELYLFVPDAMPDFLLLSGGWHSVTIQRSLPQIHQGCDRNVKLAIRELRKLHRAIDRAVQIEGNRFGVKVSRMIQLAQGALGLIVAHQIIHANDL